MIEKIKHKIPDSVKARIKSRNYSKELKRRMEQLEKERDIVTLLIGTPLHSNLGDHLITLSEKMFLEKIQYGQKIIEIPAEMYQIYRKRIIELNNVESVIITGGGWMGTIRVPEELMMQQIINDHLEKRVIIFPQTVYFDRNNEQCDSLIDSANNIFKKCRNITLCVRETNSFYFAKNNYRNVRIVLVPDIALYYFHQAPKSLCLNLKQVGICLRKDKELLDYGDKKKEIIDFFNKLGYKFEIVDTMNDSRITIEEREKVVNNRLKEFAKMDYIITDRLHGMIFSYICGIPCIVFDNNTKKVSGVYNTWFQKSKMIFPAFDNVDSKSLMDFVNMKRDNNENMCPENYYDSLKRILLNG